MFFLFLYLISFKINSIYNYETNFNLEILKNNKDKTEEIRKSFKNYLSEIFLKEINQSKFDKCFDESMKRKNGLEYFLYSLSYTGKVFADLGNEYMCIEQNFTYFLLSYDINFEETSNYNYKILQFFEKNNMYAGICLPNQCGDLLRDLFNNNTNIFVNTKIKQMNNNSKNCYEDNICESEPYFSLNENGQFDKNITLKEKIKYYAFKVLYIASIVIICFKIFISILFALIPNAFNKGNILDKKLYEGTDYGDEEDEEGTEEEIIEKVIYNNPSFSRVKIESCYEKLMKILYKYISIWTNLLVLTLRKSVFYNNKNLEIIYRIKIFCLILITFSTNLDVYIQLPSRGFFEESFCNKIYFFFIKFSSFGLDMYICLEGFETLFKFMSYYKKNFFDAGKKTLSFKGFIKFYLFSLYKIISFIIIFFGGIYLSRYYIYMHYGGKLYSYYANNLNNENILDVFNPKNNILSYFFKKGNNYDNFLFKSKMPLLFINEFCFFTIIMLIFYIGIRLKSKIYEIFILFLLLISFGSSYLCSFLYQNNNEEEIYAYKKITQNISLIKYPHIFFNHYLLGALAGVICFYLRDFATNNNSMVSEQENCPFTTLLWFIEFIDYINQKGRKIAIFILVFIQILISFFYTISLHLQNRNKEKKDYIISLNFNQYIKVIYFYESGIFIFCFCFITILLFTKNLDKKDFDNYSISNLIFQISFSFVNTVFLLMYTFYCYYEIQLKLTYQNLWLSTFGLFFIFCIENLVITILIIMPLKMFIKKIIIEKIIINSNEIQEFRYRSYNTLNNDTLLNKFNNNFQEEDLES